MERVVKKPSAILVSDIHLREDVPVCRTDDYWTAQWRKIDFISNLQKKWNIPVLHGGDLFDKWKPSPWLLTETIKRIPAKFFSCMGQHDVPQHNMDLAYKSGFGTIKEAEYIKNSEDWDSNIEIHFCHFGQEPPIDIDKRIKHILVWHKMVWQGKKPYPTCTDEPASSILKKYPMYNTILCGDNHKTFVEEYEGRLLVNPGSMMRMDADQADHKPCVFLWYAEDNSVQQVFLPIEEGVVSREHLVVKQERDSRIDAFISKLNDKYEVSLSFEDNLTAFFNANNTDSEIKQIIYKSIEKWK